MNTENLERRLRSADTGEVEIVVMQEADGVDCHAEPLWRSVNRYIQLCSELPEPALELQAKRLREAARELEESNETDR